MGANNVFRWIDGAGWLVLSGGADSFGEIRARVLGRAAADGGVVYISLDIEDGEVIDDMDDLGAPTGYTLDVISEDDETIVKHLTEASVVVVQNADSVDNLLSALSGAATKGLQAAFERGAVILAEGLGAHVFGAWVVAGPGQLKPGLDWVKKAFIIPTAAGVADADKVRETLEKQPEAIAIGIRTGSAMVFGPGGEIETWGDGQITVALGSGYGT